MARTLASMASESALPGIVHPQRWLTRALEDPMSDSPDADRLAIRYEYSVKKMDATRFQRAYLKYNDSNLMLEAEVGAKKGYAMAMELVRFLQRQSF